MMANLYGSLEAGGTKFVCAVGDDELNIVERIQFKTTTVKETLDNTINFFKQFDNLVSLSIGSFGPIDIDLSSPTYGYITKTPKPNWSNTNIVKILKEGLNIPIYFTTDVNSSAYGEMLVRENIKSLAYFTIGTGIGAGVISNGKFIGDARHPEMGHILVAKHPKDLQHDFKGICPFHDGCLEGMAAGPSIEKRCGIKGENIKADNPVWDIEAYYLAQAVQFATVSFRPDVIVFGGGVFSNDFMLKKVKDEFLRLFNDYLPIPNIDEYIVRPIIENNGSATIGNFALAKQLTSDC